MLCTDAGGLVVCAFSQAPYWYFDAQGEGGASGTFEKTGKERCLYLHFHSVSVTNFSAVFPPSILKSFLTGMSDIVVPLYVR